MKKYIISSVLIIAATLSAAAEGSAVAGSATLKARPMMPAQGGPMNMNITTGDAITDAKIKALQIEMEAKIKTLHEDYMKQIKVVIGDKKVLTGGMMLNASATMRMGGGEHDNMTGKGEGRMKMASGTPGQGGERENMMRKSSTTPREGDDKGRMMGKGEGRMIMASGTPPKGGERGGMMRREGGKGESGVPRGARVEGEATIGGDEAESSASANTGGFGSFFRNLFGR